jgi:hypothetical protein
MPYKRQISSAQYSGSNIKYRKSDDEPYDNNPESASSTKGTITLIHDYVNKR